MKYGFIGCGNMGSAIAKAISAVTKEIFITDRSGNAKKIAQDLQITYSTAAHIAQECDRIFLAVKPQMMENALSPLKEAFQEKHPLLITMAAGLTMERIEQMAGCKLPIIRIMPNTPVAVQSGMTLYCCNEFVDKETEHSFLEDMHYTGILAKLPENLIDNAGVVSGCGPAYMYMFMEALADGAVACGVPRAQALEYAAATMIGAGQMYLQTRQHPGQMKDMVCSPGGSTIAGVLALEQHGFRGAIMECVKAAYHRNQELGKA